MPFQAHRTIPYEGTMVEEFDTLDDALDHIEKRQFSFDDVEVMEVRYVDVYSLMADRKASATSRLRGV